ncbi:MAG: helix-turn-helix domain-containing protein [Actinoplanes sp.]
MLTGPLADLVRDLAADDDLVDDVAHAARADFPEVAHLPWTESRRHVAALLAAAFTAFIRSYDRADTGEYDRADTGEFAATDFGEALRFGAERAALGVPVAGLLSGVHAGRSRLLEIAITRGRDADLPHDELLQALLRLDRFGAALERHMVDGYRTAERELNVDDRAARIRVLRRLLLGDAGPAEDPARFGLAGGGRYHCVVSDAADPAQVRALEHAFTRCGGVLAPVDGRLSGLAARLPPTRTLDPSVLVVATPPVPLPEAPAAYRLCRTALTAARTATTPPTQPAEPSQPHAPGQPNANGLVDVTDLAAETALGAQPMLAAFLSAALLTALDPADAFHRQLASTALTYLDHGQRLDLTAAAMHLHPNTVRYRLRRLQELTGFAAPATHLPMMETLRWWWGLRTWSHQPWGEATPGV